MERKEQKEGLAPSSTTPQPEDAREIRRRHIVQLVEQSIQRQKRLAHSKKRFHR